MGYTVIKSFERGIDTRRMRDTTEMGALLDAKDCHVTRGGEIEKRAAFVPVVALPSNSIGYHALDMTAIIGIQHHTWGSAATPAETPAAGVIYHSIPDPAGAALVAIMAVEEFSGKLYVVAQYAGGKIIHWWDDVPVKTWIEPGGVITDDTDPDTPVDPIIVPPPPTGTGGVKPEVNIQCLSSRPPGMQGVPAGVVELRCVWLLKPGTTYNFTGPNPDAFTLINFTNTDVGGEPYARIPVPFDWTGNNMAQTIVQQINAYASTPEFSASASGNQVRIWSETEGTTHNGWQIYVFTIGDSTISPDRIVVLSGGINRTAPGGLIGPFDPTLLDGAGDAGEPLQLGTFSIAHNNKMYSLNGAKLNFSMNFNPGRYDSGASGAGNIDMTMISNSTPILMSAADYNDNLALFCKNHILIWRMDPLPEKNYKVQVLHNTGTIAPHAVVPYGEGEVMYLDRSGIRSLRSRSGVTQAFAADLGNAIDTLILPKIEAADEVTRFHKFWGVVEPRSGRLWMALRDIIWVLSYYPSNQIAAWTHYDATSVPIDAMNTADDRVFWRSGNQVYCYGGNTGTTYDATEAMVRTPYVDGAKPATFKNWSGIDAALYGTWSIKASFDPAQPAALDLIANVTQSTYAQQKIPMNGESPAVSLELRTTFVGPAKLGNATVHYDNANAD